MVTTVDTAKEGIAFAEYEWFQTSLNNFQTIVGRAYTRLEWFGQVKLKKVDPQLTSTQTSLDGHVTIFIGFRGVRLENIKTWVTLISCLQIYFRFHTLT